MILFIDSPEKRNIEVCCTTGRLFSAAQANCRSMSTIERNRMPISRVSGPSLRDRFEKHFRKGGQPTFARKPRRIFPALIAYSNLSKLVRHKMYRNVAQPGSALPWGGRGRGFESRRSDKQMSRTAHASEEACFFFAGFNFCPAEEIVER
jgi:hypothetical protein